MSVTARSSVARMSRTALSIPSASVALRSASSRISRATTANPRPCTPARAASTAALSASSPGLVRELGDRLPELLHRLRDVAQSRHLIRALLHDRCGCRELRARLLRRAAHHARVGEHLAAALLRHASFGHRAVRDDLRIARALGAARERVRELAHRRREAARRLRALLRRRVQLLRRCGDRLHVRRHVRGGGNHRLDQLVERRARARAAARRTRAARASWPRYISMRECRTVQMPTSRSPYMSGSTICERCGALGRTLRSRQREIGDRVSGGDRAADDSLRWPRCACPRDSPATCPRRPRTRCAPDRTRRSPSAPTARASA